MSAEIRTVQPAATGLAVGRWRERYGDQKVEIRVDPRSNRDDVEFRLKFERRWGPQLMDHSTQDLHLSREGAQELRDALDKALDWTPEAAS